jgi:hypothetical protein
LYFSTDKVDGTEVTGLCWCSLFESKFKRSEMKSVTVDVDLEIRHRFW